MTAFLLLLLSAGPSTPESLPEGAVLRLGSSAWRWSLGLGGSSALSPDEKTLWSSGSGGLQLMSMADGGIVPGPPDPGTVRDFRFLLGGKEVRIVRYGHDGSHAVVERCSLPGWRVLATDRIDVGPASGDPSFRLSPDGSRLIVSGYTVRRPALHLLGTGKTAEPLPADETNGTHFTFLPDGKHIMEWSNGGLKLRDATTAKVTKVVVPPREGVWFPVGAFLPDGRSFLGRSGPPHLVRADARTGRILASVHAPFENVRLTPDAKRTVAFLGKTLIVRDAMTLRVIRSMPLPLSGIPWPQCISQDGRTIVAACGNRVVLIDMETGALRNHIPGHAGGITALRFSPDGRRLASGGQEGSAVIWDLGTGRVLRTLPGHAEGVRSLAWSPDGRTLAVGDGGASGSMSRHAYVHLHDVGAGRQRVKFAAHLSAVRSMAFLDGGRMLATAGEDDRVRWWDTEGRRLGQERDVGRPMMLSGGGPNAFFLCDGGSLWRLRPDEPAPMRLTPSPDRDGADAVALDGGRVVLLFTGKAFVRIDGASGKLLSRHEPESLKDSEGRSGGGVFSPDGRLHAVSRSGAVHFLSVPDCEYLGSFEGPARSYIQAVAFSPDSRRLAIGYSDTTILIWDVARLKGPKK